MAKKVTAQGKTFTFDDNVSNDQISTALDEYFSTLKKKVDTTVQKSGSPSSLSGLGISQDFQTNTVDPLIPTPLIEEQRKQAIQRAKTYVKPKTKPKTVKEAVDDDNSYLGAIWNQVADSASDAVGGLVKLGLRSQPSFNILSSPEMAEQIGNYSADIVNKARTESSSKENEEKIQSGFDVTDGDWGKDFKALPLMVTRLAADIGMAIPTGGGSFIAQGYSQGTREYDKVAGKNPDQNVRDLYGMGYAIVNGLLDKVGMDLLLKTPVVSKAVKNFILKSGVQALAKTEGKITAEVIEKTFAKVTKESVNKIKTAGVKTLIAGGGESVTEAIQGGLTDGLKVLANKLQGDEVFKEKEVAESFWKNRINDLAGGAVLGGALGGGMAALRSTNSYVSERIAEATSPEQLAQVQAELSQEVDSGNLDPERAEILSRNIEKYSNAVAKLPSGMSVSKRQSAMGKIVERDNLRELKQSVTESSANVDEALQPETDKQLADIDNKEQFLNDGIREDAIGEKYKYFQDEEGKKHFKQLGEGKAEEITPQYYEFQKSDKGIKIEPDVEVKLEPDTEEKITQEAQEAEKKFSEGGDQVEYEQKIAELDKRAQALKPVENKQEPPSDLPSVETVTPDVVQETAQEAILPDGTIEEHPLTTALNDNFKKANEQKPTSTQTTQPVQEQQTGQTETPAIPETINEATGDIEVGTDKIILPVFLPLNEGVNINTGIIQNSKGATYLERNLGKLAKLGYTKEEIDNLSQTELSGIIAKNIKNPNVETSAILPTAEPPVKEKGESEESNLKRRATVAKIQKADYSQEFKEAITDKEIFYKELPNKVTDKEVDALIDYLGRERAYSEVLDLNNGMSTAVRFGISQRLMDAYDAEGEYDRAIEISRNLYERITDNAQGQQYLSTFPKLSKRANVRAAEQDIKKQRDHFKKLHKDKIDKIKNAFKRDNKDAAEEMIENVLPKLEKSDEVKPKEVNRPPGYGNKNKLVTRDKYLKAKKDLRGKFFSGVPTELATIAAYHIEANSRDFAKFSRNMIVDLGNKVKPYLKDLYNKAKVDLINNAEYQESDFLSESEVDSEVRKIEGQDWKDRLEDAIARGKKKEADIALAKLQEISKEEGLWGKYKKQAVSKLKGTNVANTKADTDTNPPLREFTDGLVRNMQAKINGSLPAKTKAERPPLRPAIEVLGDAYKNFEKYQEVWEATQKAFTEKYANEPDVLDAMDEHFGELLSTPFSQKIINKAVDESIGKSIKYLTDLKDKGFDISSFKGEVIEKMIYEMGITEEQASDLIDEVTKNLNERQENSDKALADKQAKAIEKALVEKVKKQPKNGAKPVWKDRKETIKKALLNKLRSGIINTNKAQKTAVEIFANRLKSNLLTSVDNLVKPSIEKQNPMDVLIDIIKNNDIYQNVIDETHQAVFDEFADRPEMLLLLEDALFGVSETHFNKGVSRVVTKGLDEMGVTGATVGTSTPKPKRDGTISLSKLVMQHYTVVDNTKRKLVDKLIQDAGLEGKEAQELAQAIEQEFDRIATAKKKKALDDIFSKRERKKHAIRSLEGDLIKLTNLGAFRENDLVEAYGDKMGWPQLTQENIKEIERLSDVIQRIPDGPRKRRAIEDLLAYQAGIKGTSITELLTAVWYSNMLSGFNTHETNVVANAINVALLYANAIAQNPKASVFVAKGLIDGLKRGFFEGKETWLTGYSPIKGKAEVPSLLERYKFTGLASPLNKLKYVRRAMVAADVVFFEGLKEMRAYQLAYKMALEEGKLEPTLNQRDRAIEIIGKSDGQLEIVQEQAQKELETEINNISNIPNITDKQKSNLINEAKSDSKRRLFDLIEAQRGDLIEQTASFAAKGTFNYPPQGVLGAAASMINQMVENVPQFRWVVPFTNIIANIANESIDYTPLGFARLQGLSGNKDGGLFSNFRRQPLTPQERADLRTKAIIGTGLTVALAVLASSGDDEEPYLEITANGTGDYRKNEVLKATGWQPYSLRFKMPNGNYSGWISYQYSPLMPSFAFLGNYKDLTKYKEDTEDAIHVKLSKTAGMTTTAFFQTTYLEGLNQFLSNLTDPRRSEGVVEKGLKGVTGAVKGVLIPNLYTQTAKEIQRMNDIPAKEVRQTLVGSILQDLPYARDMYYNKVNILGDPIVVDTDKFYSDNKTDKIIQLIVDNNAMWSPMSPKTEKIYDVKTQKERAFTEKEFYDYSMIKGNIIKQSLTNGYVSLSKMPEKAFKKEMSKIKEIATKSAKDQVMALTLTN